MNQITDQSMLSTKSVFFQRLLPLLFVIAVALFLSLLSSGQNSCSTRPLNIEKITHHCEQFDATLKRIESQRYGERLWPINVKESQK